MDRPVISPLLFYRDPKAALAFLQNAFGFETPLLVEDGQGGVIHSESFFGGELVMVGGSPCGLSPAEMADATSREIRESL
jgi:uncharacterized glyoxalase superfamily protein PhnB